MTTITAVGGSLHDQAADTAIIYAFEGEPLSGEAAALDAALNGLPGRLIALGDFTGRAGETAALYPPEGAAFRRVALAGLGPRAAFSVEAARRAAASAILKARDLHAEHVAAALPGAETGLPVDDLAQAAAEAMALALYTFSLKSGEESPAAPGQIDLLAGDIPAAERGIAAARAIADGVKLARRLVDLPPNVKTAPYLADAARQMAGEAGLRVETLDEEQIAALKMGAFLAVARGSDTPPRFVILEHNAGRSDLPTLALVGKGITFDTGGYNVKSDEGMGTMKSDMAGAAAVFGALRAIAALGLPLHVVGLTPLVDNMISGRAYRPQEVVTASNGVTIEVGNTDAEGRMALADALVYAARFNPNAVIDIATLTGSSVTALGRLAASLFSTDDALRDRLVAAAAATSERVWPMPLYEDYKNACKSHVADVKNTCGSYGGVGCSAIFLRHFVSYPAWAHVDMAGMALKVNEIEYPPYVPGKGATGYGVRLFVELARRWGG